MKRQPITTAATALEAHMNIDTKGFNAKKQAKWDSDYENLQKAADQEKLDNEKEYTKEELEANGWTALEVTNDGTQGKSGDTETKVESKNTENQEKEKKVEVKITSAIYGRDGKTIEVSKFLNELNNGGNGRKITNKLFGGQDPLKNKIKMLNVTYTVNGEERKTMCMENEKLELNLEAPVAKAEETKKEETAKEETKQEETATA